MAKSKIEDVDAAAPEHHEVEVSRPIPFAGDWLRPGTTYKVDATTLAWLTSEKALAE